MKLKLNYMKPGKINLEESWPQEEGLEIFEIKKGDKFYECELRDQKNYEFIALTDAKQLKEGWMCTAKNKKGEIIEFYVSNDARELYKPFLFKVPQYAELKDEIASYAIC